VVPEATRETFVAFCGGMTLSARRSILSLICPRERVGSSIVPCPLLRTVSANDRYRAGETPLLTALQDESGD
jgi:hypothetical protein